MDKKTIIERYVELSRRLGKLPSQRQSHGFGIPMDSVKYHFKKHSELQKQVLQKHPELQELFVPVALKVNDVETFRLNLEKKLTNKDNKNLVEDVSLLDYISNFAEQVFEGKVKPCKVKKKVRSKRTHTLVLSDLHFGSDLKGDETGSLDFGNIEEARRFAEVIKQASLYKEQYHDVTHLEILLLGDIIEGQLHDPRTGAVMAEQCCRAIHLIIQGIAYLANFYPTVTVRCATGNHGRNILRHAGRAVHQKFDSYETIIYYGIKKALSNLKNVTVEIPKTPLSSYEVYGKKIGFTHGDTVINPGNPGSNLNVNALSNKVNQINAALPDNQEYAAIVYGHTHVLHTVYLSNGTVLIGNGSLPPADHFCASLGILESNNGQWIFESVPGYAVGDMRAIRTGEAYDKDASLDKIIQPWVSFDE